MFNQNRRILVIQHDSSYVRAWIVTLNVMDMVVTNHIATLKQKKNKKKEKKELKMGSFLGPVIPASLSTFKMVHASLSTFKMVLTFFQGDHSVLVLFCFSGE